MRVDYLGGMKLVARNRGLEVTSDQPMEAGGNDSAMTPPELFVASLGTCVGVYVLNFAKRQSIPVEGMSIEVDYTYADAPRRIGSVQVRVKMPHPVPEALRLGLRRTADQCLVHNSLRQPPEVTISVDL